MANDENLKSYKKGVSGNPAGRPKGPKTNEQNVADLRELLDIKVDDEIASILPLTESKPEFLEKIKREHWSLEKIMDFFAIMGAIGGQSSYSYYREIKDRVYGKSDMVSGESRPGRQSALDKLTPIKAKAKAAKAKATSGAIKLPPLSGWKKQTYSPMGEGASWVKYTWGNLLIMDSEDLKVFGAEVAQEYDGQLGWYDYEEVAESGSVSPYKKGSAGEARKLLQAWVNANPDKVVPGSTKAKKPEQVFAVYGSKGGPKLGTVGIAERHGS